MHLCISFVAKNGKFYLLYHGILNVMILRQNADDRSDGYLGCNYLQKANVLIVNIVDFHIGLKRLPFEISSLFWTRLKENYHYFKGRGFKSNDSLLSR